MKDHIAMKIQEVFLYGTTWESLWNKKFQVEEIRHILYYSIYTTFIQRWYKQQKQIHYVRCQDSVYLLGWWLERGMCGDSGGWLYSILWIGSCFLERCSDFFLNPPNCTLLICAFVILCFISVKSLLLKAEYYQVIRQEYIYIYGWFDIWK